MSRDEFSEKTKRQLARRVAYKCSNPECRRTTTGPKKDTQGSTNIGVAGHIHAASKNGPRYNPNQTAQERKSLGNGIWLCQNCAKLVDSDDSRYAANTLHRWKEQAEESAHLALQQQAKSVDNLDSFLRIVDKMPKLLQEMANDLHKNKGKLIREFVVLNSRGNIFQSRKARFVYYKEDHPIVQNEVDLLFEYGFIKDVTPKSHPVYRMTEEFVELLTTLYPK